MYGPVSADPFTPRLLTMRIIHGSLCLGAAVVLAIALWVRSQGNQQTPEVPIVSYTGLVMLACCLAAALFVTRSIDVSARKMVGPPASGSPEHRRDNALRWWGVYQTRMIVRDALVEGPTFMLAIAYLLEGQTWTLGVTVGLIVLLLLLTPTRSGVDAWVARQQASGRG
jgi:hypothetical protein